MSEKTDVEQFPNNILLLTPKEIPEYTSER